MKTMTRVLALSGGVGGAKLVHGLNLLDDVDLTVVVNTADDFEHIGLLVSPDIDSIVYALGDLADIERGWGRADETWRFMEEIERLGTESWFLMGDRDLAMHVARSAALRNGEKLSAFTARIAARLGIRAAVLPMTNNRVRTMVDTSEGRLEFQRYFVGRRCEPSLIAVDFEGAAEAHPPAEVVAALKPDNVPDIVLICPSNPYLSVDPILAVQGLRDLLVRSGAPIVAVSPIVAGEAVKGPTAKIMRELGLAVTNATISNHYGDLLDGLVVDTSDDAPSGALKTLATGTLMRAVDDKVRLARQSVDFALSLGRRTKRP